MTDREHNKNVAVRVKIETAIMLIGKDKRYLAVIKLQEAIKILNEEA